MKIAIIAPLVTAIREAGYEALVCQTAQAGLETACAIQPDCIICDIALPDNDGYWVARNVRTHPSRVSVTPRKWSWSGAFS